MRTKEYHRYRSKQHKRSRHLNRNAAELSFRQLNYAEKVLGKRRMIGYEQHRRLKIVPILYKVNKQYGKRGIARQREINPDHYLEISRAVYLCGFAERGRNGSEHFVKHEKIKTQKRSPHDQHSEHRIVNAEVDRRLKFGGLVANDRNHHNHKNERIHKRRKFIFVMRAKIRDKHRNKSIDYRATYGVYNRIKDYFGKRHHSLLFFDLRVFENQRAAKEFLL